MTNTIIKILFLFSLFSLIICSVLSCYTSSNTEITTTTNGTTNGTASTTLTLPIVSKWADTTTRNTVEFTEDGYVVINYGGYLVSGEYQLIGNNVVKLSFKSFPTTLESVFGADTWQYNISGDTMFVQANSCSCVLIRNGSLSSVVSFPDPKLQAAIRKAINKPTGNIYLSDLSALTQLDASLSNISNLAGIEYCTSLTTLGLPGNQINDISLLAFLPNLTSIQFNGNQISDISPLASLTKLNGISLDNNEIINISTLKYLPNLTGIDLSYNQISDISPLISLTKIDVLNLSFN